MQDIEHPTRKDILAIIWTILGLTAITLAATLLPGILASEQDNEENTKTHKERIEYLEKTVTQLTDSHIELILTVQKLQEQLLIKR